MNQEYQQILALIVLSSIAVSVGVYFLYRFGDVPNKNKKKNS